MANTQGSAGGIPLSETRTLCRKLRRLRRRIRRGDFDRVSGASKKRIVEWLGGLFAHKAPLVRIGVAWCLIEAQNRDTALARAWLRKRRKRRAAAERRKGP